MAGELADALIARIDTLIQARLDAAITSRLAASSYVVPNNAGVAAVQAKTDLIPAAGPPSAADYTPARAALLDSLDALISSRAAASDYTPARAALLDRLDALISSRATDAGVWAAATRTLTAVPSVIRSIQQGQIFFTFNTASTLTIAPVDTSKTVLITHGSTAADTSFILVMARLFLVSSTSVRADKWNEGGNGVYVNFSVVEFM